MSTLPPFEQNGLLPVGDYELTLDELKQSHLVTGQFTGNTIWEPEWRLKLINNAEVLIKQLWQVDITEIFIDGSFVEDKSRPNDIDGYFCCDFGYFITGAMQRDLNAIDPNKVWTWDDTSRSSRDNYAKPQLPMWHHYRVELYPHYDNSQLSGIRDKFGNPRTFPSAFRMSRNDDLPKGIIKIKHTNT